MAATIAAIEDDLIALRRDLHAHPELSWEEHRTTAQLLEALRAHGIAAEVGPTGTGVIADVGTEGPLVALRGDIDALRMQDTKEVPYRSRSTASATPAATTSTPRPSSAPGIALHRELSQAPVRRAGCGSCSSLRRRAFRVERSASSQRAWSMTWTPCSPSTRTRLGRWAPSG